MIETNWSKILDVFRPAEQIHVTRPTLPDLDKYADLLEEVWRTGWITNEGALHHELEQRLMTQLGVQHISLFCNGTIALLVALQALDIQEGEVITTPFTFPATPHALHWNKVTPVFADIDPLTLNLDPARVSEQITPQTKAILPVHIFGVPCDVDALQAIADEHGIPVIYDAAHSFGARYRGRALSDYGDLAVLSFHGTKLFTTGEGGAIVSHSEEMKEHVYFLKNFGIEDQETVHFPGINGKMSELSAALGIENLKLVDEEIVQRGEVIRCYDELLIGMPGLTVPKHDLPLEPNNAYYPVLINEAVFGCTRDTVHDALQKIDVLTRKYFYPLCSRVPAYQEHPSSSPENLPVAERVSQEILCLPLYGRLGLENATKIAQAIRAIHEHVG